MMIYCLKNYLMQSPNVWLVIELKFASVLLKLENCFLVPSAAVNELLDDLQYLMSYNI